MPALYFTMTKDSLHISMLFRTRLDYEADRDDGLYNFVHVVHDKHLCRGSKENYSGNEFSAYSLLWKDH